MPDMPIQKFIRSFPQNSEGIKFKFRDNSTIPFLADGAVVIPYKSVKIRVICG